MDELLDALLDQGKADVIATIAEPLPLIVIAELLGVPAADRLDFKRWSDAAIALASGGLDLAAQAAADAERRELTAYLVPTRTRSPVARGVTSPPVVALAS